MVIVGRAVDADQGGPPARVVSEGGGATIDVPRLYHSDIFSDALASPMDWKRKKRSRA